MAGKGTGNLASWTATLWSAPRKAFETSWTIPPRSVWPEGLAFLTVLDRPARWRGARTPA
jgi:hypothetical protein